MSNSACNPAWVGGGAVYGWAWGGRALGSPTWDSKRVKILEKLAQSWTSGSIWQREEMQKHPAID